MTLTQFFIACTRATRGDGSKPLHKLIPVDMSVSPRWRGGRSSTHGNCCGSRVRDGDGSNTRPRRKTTGGSRAVFRRSYAVKSRRTVNVVSAAARASPAHFDEPAGNSSARVRARWGGENGAFERAMPRRYRPALLTVVEAVRCLRQIRVNRPFEAETQFMLRPGVACSTRSSNLLAAHDGTKVADFVMVPAKAGLG
jgi:hypothetical protein